MGIKFEDPSLTGEFKRPLLDAAEERLAREARGDTDLAVEGLRHSLLSRFVGLFAGGRSSAS
jgi:hypothetical protein